MPTREPPTTMRPPVSAGAGPAGEESSAGPAIPSFASLRGPRRPGAVDLLLPGAASAPPADRPTPVLSASRPTPVPSASRPTPLPSATRPTPRPAEYADLLRFGLHLVRVAAAVPGRLAGWAVREQRSCLRRVLGG